MLLSAREVPGDEVTAQDGAIGYIGDLLFDHVGWTIRGLVVATGNWFSGEAVVIDPAVVVGSGWTSGRVPAALSRAQVEVLPAADGKLHRASEITGFQVMATDGEIGHVTTMLFEAQTWRVRYLVVDLGVWIAGRSVLLAPGAVHEIDWTAQNVAVALDRATVKDSPEYDATQELNREYEEFLHDYYGWPTYWG